MSGLYLHIPYCKKVCTYCDFHFSASLKNKPDLLKALAVELEMQKNYLKDNHITTLYFGGGTPSVLTIDELEVLLNSIQKNYNTDDLTEFTFEVNPDDLTPGYLHGLQSLGVNRLSIGIQSFSDTDLRWMNRRHNSADALLAIDYAKTAGFSNITIDFIYGLPCSTTKTWETNLEIFHKLEIPHLSAYHLTIEPKTTLGVWQKRGKVSEIDEDTSVKQYEILLNTMENKGFENYEISNFCKPGNYSKHNLNYWKQGPYLGVGPSAHSYNGTNRQWNISVNQRYIDLIKKNEVFYELEILNRSESFNDYILTHLRTQWGIILTEIESKFGKNYSDFVNNEINTSINPEWIEQTTTGYKLSRKGKFVANQVISALMYV